jgi:hypothetical protein
VQLCKVKKQIIKAEKKCSLQSNKQMIFTGKKHWQVAHPAPQQQEQCRQREPVSD